MGFQRFALKIREKYHRFNAVNHSYTIERRITMKDKKDYIDINESEATETKQIEEKKPGRFKRAYLAFTGKAVEEVEKDDKEEKKGMKKGTKIALGVGLGTAALAGLAALIKKAARDQQEDVDDVNDDDEDDQEYSEEELTED